MRTIKVVDVEDKTVILDNKQQCLEALADYYERFEDPAVGDFLVELDENIDKLLDRAVERCEERTRQWEAARAYVEGKGALSFLGRPVRQRYAHLVGRERHS